MKVGLEKLEFGYSPEAPLFSIPELHIETGQSVGIVGPSGAGKTTLLRILSGICLPTSGRVRLGELEINTLSDAERRRFRNERVGLVFQDFRLLEYLTVRENMMLPFHIGLRQSDPNGSKTRVDMMAPRLGLVERIDAYPGELSQGEQQRVAIGRALVASPQLILADEPTGNLDESNKLKIRDLLLSYCRDQEVTLIMVTHDLQLLGDFDRVIDFSAFRSEADLA